MNEKKLSLDGQDLQLPMTPFKTSVSLMNLTLSLANGIDGLVGIGGDGES